MTQADFNHLLSSIKALAPARVRSLPQQLDRQSTQPKKPHARPTARAFKQPRTTAAPKKKMTEAEFDQLLLKIGLVSSLPVPALDIDDDAPVDAPVTMKPEPLSETIILEQR
jgi:hypothetical protein